MAEFCHYFFDNFRKQTKKYRKTTKNLILRQTVGIFYTFPLFGGKHIYKPLFLSNFFIWHESCMKKLKQIGQGQMLNSKRFLRQLIVANLLICGTASSQAAANWAGDLPDYTNPLYAQQFGDFFVYSFGLLDNIANKGDPVLSSGLDTVNGYYVPSGPGQILDDIVLVTGALGAPSDNNPNPPPYLPCGINGCDDAYPYVPSNVNFFTTAGTTDPTPVVSPADGTDTWTINIATLRTFLNGSEFVMLANLNERNSNNTPDEGIDQLEGQDLLTAWKVTLMDSSGTPNDPMSFYLGAHSGIVPDPQDIEDLWNLDGAPDADPANLGTTHNPADIRWAYVHGGVSTDTTTGQFLDFGSCATTLLPNCTTVNQSLGANQAAFAVYNPFLANMVKNTNLYDYMEIEMLTSYQRGGYEQVFIRGGVTVDVPEPGMLGIFGLGLIGLGMIRRRRRVIA